MRGRARAAGAARSSARILTLATFALLPQIGWHFADPFFAALVFTFAPVTSGRAQLDLGFQAVLGAGFKVAEEVSVNAALEVPWNFRIRNTIGITPLLGLSFKLGPDEARAARAASSEVLDRGCTR